MPGQTAPHWPQFNGSLLRFTHAPPQSVVPVAQLAGVGGVGVDGVGVVVEGGFPGLRHLASQALLSAAHSLMQMLLLWPVVPPHTWAQLTLHWRKQA